VVTRRDDERELAHNRAAISTLRETIETLKSIKSTNYEDEIEDLENQLVELLLEQVALNRLRSDEFRQVRLAEVSTNHVGQNIVASAAAEVFLSPPPLSTPRVRGTPRNSTSSTKTSSNRSIVEQQPSADVPPASQFNIDGTFPWISAEHFNVSMHHMYGTIGSEHWCTDNVPDVGVLYGLQALRDDLTETFDRWQVEIWIKLFATMLDVDHEITYDARDGKSVESETVLGTNSF
jgi:hypothetical protein